MAKITFKHDSVCFLDHAIEAGLPFWHDFGDNHNSLTQTKQIHATGDVEHNKISKDFLYSKIVSTVTKQDFAGELINISGTVKNILKRISKEKEEHQPLYL
jgi:hypothetical protein